MRIDMSTCVEQGDWLCLEKGTGVGGRGSMPEKGGHKGLDY